MKSFTIYDWMIKKCKLNGSSLVIFALIYEDWQKGCDSFEIAQNTGFSLATVYRCLYQLKDKNLIKCHEDNYHKYTVSDKILAAWVANELDLKELIRIAKTPWVKRSA